MPKNPGPETTSHYPNIQAWTSGRGWVEIGRDGRSGSFARALDEGGLCWAGKRKYPSLEVALQDLDRGIAAWLKENG